MRTGAILATVIVVLLALPFAAYAQATDPVTVSEAFVADINEGYREAAANAVAEDAVVEAPQAMSEGEAEAEGADPSAQTQHVGKAEVEAWIEGYMSAVGETTLGECVVEGEIVTCDAKFKSDKLNAMGITEIEGEVMMQVNAEGKVQSFAFTPTAESAAVLQAAGAAAAAPEAAAPEAAEAEPAEAGAMPVTGSDSLLRLALFVVLTGLIAAGALGVGLLLGRWRRAFDG